MYGIPNCDTVKRARSWLNAQGRAHAFVDFKRAGVPVDEAEQWLATIGRDKLINRQGSTWRKLDANMQALASSDAGALQLMQQQSSVIKRPVVKWPDGSYSVGFDEAEWLNRLAR